VVVDRKVAENDWVVGDVNITLIPDPDDIMAVYYKLDDGEWTLYNDFVVVSEDGFHSFWWYIIDDMGYTSDPDSISFKIDQTPSMIELTKEKIGVNKIKFIANANDDTSGVDKVEFYVEGMLESTVSSPPYEWIWKGWRNVKVTAMVYDNAGNSNSSSMYTWRSQGLQQPSNLLFLQILQQLLNLR